MYAIECKDGPKAKWRQARLGRHYQTKHIAIDDARAMDELGGGVYRVVDTTTGEVVWTPSADRAN